MNFTINRKETDGDAETPAANPDMSYREEDSTSTVNKTRNEEDNLNPHGRLLSDGVVLKTRSRCLQIGTWNVRTLFQPGKFDNAIQEMESMNLDILGLAEIRWTDSGKITKDSHTMIYSGGKKHMKGVGIIMKDTIERSMIGYWAISERVIMMKLQSKPFNINIIQVYAPTQDYDDEEVEAFYEEIQVAIKNTKSDDILCIMGDLNAKVGKEKHTDIVGNYGLGKRNERGERMIQFCILNKLFITNTWFQHPSRKLYTWKSPGDITRNQIDYIMINQRYRNIVKRVKTYPGADINSDHNPVVMKVNIKLKKIKKHQKWDQLDLNLLRQEEYKTKFNLEIRNKYDILCAEEDVKEQQQTENTEQRKWKIFKECIHESTKEVLPRKEKDNNQKWMTREILEMMEIRKQFKITADHNKYREINKKIITACRKAKDDWLNQQCQEIENLEQHFKSKEMHKRVKQLTGKSKSAKGSGCIKNKDGDILFDQDEIAARWVEYVTELYDDEREPMPQFEVINGENILKDEVEKAISSMKNGKATGPDQISAETLKALDENNIEIITNLCSVIYNSGQIPPEMKQSVFITLPKKHKTQNCTEHRTISLMSHVTKLLLKIILQRIINKINQEVSRLQSGFRSGTGTREGIFNLRTICERSLEVQKDVYICFIDYKKAFDRVNHSKMIECLQEIGIDGKDLQIIAKLYWEQTAVVRTEKGVTSEFNIKKGVRQGCILSPSLFNLYTEKIFRQVEDMKGIMVGGVNINNLRYADDTVLIADSAAQLQELINAVNENGKPYGMEMNVEKTKSMVISKVIPVPRVNIMLETVKIKQTANMVYLGHMVTEDGKNEIEIKRRIAIAKDAFNNMAIILTSRNLKLETKKRLVKCYIWSTLLYGSETWTLTKVMMTKIEAFEMWIYRRMLKISYTEHRTNEFILRTIKAKRSLMHIVMKRKCAYFGHVMRREDDLQRLLLEGKMNGRRGRGRPRSAWFHNIKEWTGMRYADCSRKAQHREEWKSMTANLLKADGT